MSGQSWVPAGLDVDRPSVARMYDYLLGGGHNFALDRAVAAGSYLAPSHFTADIRPEEMAAAVEVSKRSSERLCPRSREEIAALFAGFDLVEPGLVSTARWRPDTPVELGPDADHSGVYAGVGRKP